MLVLSRRTEEKILLPTVPASIKVISAHNGQARLGIEAPPQIPILREELCSDHAAGSLAVEPLALAQVLRNRLNNVILGVALLRAHFQKGNEELRQNLAGIEQELEVIRLCLLAGPPERGVNTLALA
jgi:carbon storage regulator CsrA